MNLVSSAKIKYNTCVRWFYRMVDWLFSGRMVRQSVHDEWMRKRGEEVAMLWLKYRRATELFHDDVFAKAFSPTAKIDPEAISRMPIIEFQFKPCRYLDRFPLHPYSIREVVEAAVMSEEAAWHVLEPMVREQFREATLEACRVLHRRNARDFTKEKQT